MSPFQTQNLYVTGNAHVTSNISTDSNVIIGATTATTSKTTGAIRVAGGVGIQGDLHATDANLENVEADSVTVTNSVDATDTITGALKVAGGLGVEKTIFAADMSSGSVNITDNTNSTDKDTGALIVQSGGAGIELNLNVGGTGKIWDETDATTTTSGALQFWVDSVLLRVYMPPIQLLKVSTSQIQLYLQIQPSGALQVAGGVGVANNVHVGNDVYIGSNLNVDTTTLHVDSVSNRVGIGKTNPGFTLDINGDINFSGDLYEGGSQFISSPWEIESSPLHSVTQMDL